MTTPAMFAKVQTFQRTLEEKGLSPSIVSRALSNSVDEQYPIALAFPTWLDAQRVHEALRETYPLCGPMYRYVDAVIELEADSLDTLIGIAQALRD